MPAEWRQNFRLAEVVVSFASNIENKAHITRILVVVKLPACLARSPVKLLV